MSTIAATPHRNLRLLVHLSNPVYLLSSVCMLASCVLLANDSHSRNVPLTQLLSLVGTLLLYQGCLFLIGTFLSLKRGIFRDGRTLLVLDAVFLADITFVNSELLTTDLRTGLAIGLAMFALSAVRIHWIAGRLGGSIPLYRYLLILMQLLLIIAIPAYLKHIDNGLNVTANVLYGFWWTGGIIIAGMLLLDSVLEAPTPHHPKARWIQPTYLTIGWLSLVLHLAVLHYVYAVNFHGVMVVPAMVGLAMLLRRLDEQRSFAWLGQTGGAQVTLLVLAFVSVVNSPGELGLHFGPIFASATKLGFAAVYLGVVYMYFRHVAGWLITAAAILTGAVIIAPTWQQIMAWIDAVARFIGAIMPRTRVAWGVIGIIASFALLAVGTMLSLRKPPDARPVPLPETVQ